MCGVKPVKGVFIFFSLFIFIRGAFLLSPGMVDDQEGGGDGDDDQDGGGDGDLPLEKTVVEKPVDDCGSAQRAPHLFAMYHPFSQLNSSQVVFCLMHV